MKTTKTKVQELLKNEKLFALACNNCNAIFEYKGNADTGTQYIEQVECIFCKGCMTVTQLTGIEA